MGEAPPTVVLRILTGIGPQQIGRSRFGRGQKRKRNSDRGGRRKYYSSRAEMFRIEGERIKRAFKGFRRVAWSQVPNGKTSFEDVIH
eukprot:5069773-Ditylum_brightwellii.AAC.1